MKILRDQSESRDQRGFLLIEMLVILTILGISLLAILSQSSSAIRGNQRAEQGSIATSLAEAKIEALKAWRFADIASGVDPAPLDSEGNPGGIFSRSWTVTPDTVNGVAAKRIAVQVSWRETAGNPRVILSTLIVDIPQYAANYPTVVEHSWRRQ